MYEAQVLADSVDERGNRIVTALLTYPRVIHSEFMTHRVFGRNAASTRAIPLATQIRNLLENPFVPERFGVNQPGMQSSQWLSGSKHDEAVQTWLNGRDRAITTALELILGREVMSRLRYEPMFEYLDGTWLLENFDEIEQLLPRSTDGIDLGETTMLSVHKQLAGRGLEPYMWMTVIVTATEWDNYFALRDHPDAQGEIAKIARMTRAAIDASSPMQLSHGEWHLPLVTLEERLTLTTCECIMISAARCAAVSYRREMSRNPAREFTRYADLVRSGHMSPLEHQATPFSPDEWRIRRLLVREVRRVAASHLTSQECELLIEAQRFKGPLRGWTSHRKTLPGESNYAQLLRGVD